MMDGAAERAARLICGAAEAVASASLLLLENMAASLDKSARISHDVGEPHFIVHVWSCAAPGGSEFSDERALRNFLADMDENRRHVAVTGVNSVAMVNFDHI